MKKSRNIYIILGLIFLLALFFRLANTDHFFPSSDSVWLARIVSLYFPDNWEGAKTLFTDFHGMAAPIIGVITVLFSKWIGITINEAVFNFPFAVIGASTALLAYGLAKRILDEKAGLIAAFFIAVFPLHIIVSRNSGFGFSVISILLELAMLIFIFDYFKNPNGKNLWKLSLTFATYILFGLFFPFITLLLLIWGVYVNYQNSWKQAFKRFGGLVLKWPLIVFPILALYVQLLITGVGRGILNKGCGVPDFGIGFYWQEYILNGIYFNSWPIWIIIISFMVISVYQISKSDNLSFLTIWIVILSLMFLFLFKRHPTRYFLHLAIPMLILLAVWINNLLKSTKIFRYIGTVMLGLILILTTGFSAGGISQNEYFLQLQKKLSLIKCNPSCMEIHNYDNGIKSAAWWLRNNSENDDVIMPFSIGGMGLESSVLDYYLKRNHISTEDPTLASASYLLENYQALADYLLIEGRYYDLAINLIGNEFTKKVTIVNKHDPILYIYGKKKDQQSEIIEVEETIPKFDQQFGSFEEITKHLP